MRIVCEQCQTKYIVPDEKIVKNVLRLTCQKCGHVITARVDGASSNSVSAASSASGNTLDKWRTSSAQSSVRRTQSSVPEWYYSYNGESFGPFTEQELIQKLLSDKILPVVEHCYIWRKSFTNWKPVMQVEPFASAVSSPPPPPAPPAPKPANPNMPPLLHDDSDATQQLKAPLFSLFADSSSSLAVAPSSSISKAVAKSSPDVPGLKQRLQTSGDTGSSHARLNFPMPKAKVSDQSSAEEEEVGDTTRVGAPSPFFSFQSLDAISSDIKAESKAGKAPEMVKPFPSLSGIPSISKDKNSAKPGFGASPVPGINTLFGNHTKSSTVPRISSMRSSTTPILNSDASSSQSAQTTTAITQKSPIPTVTAPAHATALEEMPDFQEDIGSIVASQTPMALLQADEANRDGSISNWLPSASDIRLNSRVEGISLPDISLSTSSELEHVESSAALKDTSSSEILSSSDDIPDIDIEDDSSQIFHRDNIDLDKILGSADDLEAINLDDDSSGLPGTEKVETSDDDEDEMKLMSGAQMLNFVRQSTASNKSVQRDAELASADLAEIDLEDDDSQFIAANVIDDIASNEPKRSGIVGNTDDLFADQPEEEQSVAKVRASHNKLEEIAAKYSDIFDLPDPEPQHDENGISENSMMIQLAHFTKSQQKEERKRNTTLGLIALISVCVVVLCVAGGFVVKQVAEDDDSEQKVGFAKVEGRAVSSDELNAIAPIEDFAIVTDIPEPKKTSRSRSAKSDSDKTDTAKSDTEENEAEETAAESAAAAQPDAPAANEDVLAALYGTDKPEEPDKPMAIPTNKKDGRANIVLKSAGEFGSTDAVKGSKYGQLNAGGAATSRELFSIGLRNVSQTVQECHKREAKTGNMMVPKIYLRLTVEPSGVVNSFEVEEKEVPESFIKCLDGKKDRWKFAPFEGSAVKMRQGFVLG